MSGFMDKFAEFAQGLTGDSNAGADVTTDVANWDHYNNWVEHLNTSGSFVNSASTLLLAGPPRVNLISELANGGLYAVGLVQNLQVSQSKTMQKLFELGSLRSSHVPGQTIVNVSLGRAMMEGNTLLKAMFSFYNKLTSEEIAYLGKGMDLGPNSYPGHGNFWINLRSPIFDRPVGLAVMMRNAAQQPVGSFYIEEVYVNAHSLGLSAGAPVLIESVGIMCDRIVPIQYMDAADGDLWGSMFDTLGVLNDLYDGIV